MHHQLCVTFCSGVVICHVCVVHSSATLALLYSLCQCCPAVALHNCSSPSRHDEAFLHVLPSLTMADTGFDLKAARIEIMPCLYMSTGICFCLPACSHCPVPVSLNKLLHGATVGSVDRLDGTHNPVATAACLPLHTRMAHCQ